MWLQKNLILKPYTRGFHLITYEICDAVAYELAQINIGIMHVFIQHTSASLTISENAAPDVRTDFEAYFNDAVPENAPFYQHLDEGADDMPAHIKASLLGSSVTIPISQHGLNMGTWQGIYLCEHRNRGGSRSLIITLNGE